MELPDLFIVFRPFDSISDQVLNRIQVGILTADCADNTDGKERHERHERQASHSSSVLSAQSAVELFPTGLRR
jgi:hypothetical protein